MRKNKLLRLLKDDNSYSQLLPASLRPNCLGFWDANNLSDVNYTLNQALLNGNFADTTGWTAYSSTKAAANNTLALTGDGSGALPQATKATGITCVSGNKIYIRAFARATNASCLNLILYVEASGGSVSVKTQNSPAQNTWYSISGIATVTAGMSGLARGTIAHQYADNATANGAVLEIQNVQVFDLTTIFGAGNEPTAAEFTDILNSCGTVYWEGNKTVCCNPTYKYGTLNNKLFNGNFVNTDKWTAYLGTTSAANNTLSATGDGSGVENGIYQVVNILNSTNKKIDIGAWRARVTNASCLYLRVQVYSSDGGTSLGMYSIANPVENQWYNLSGIISLTGGTAGDTLRVYIIQIYADAETQSGKVMELEKAMAFDLTEAFGYGNEPSKVEIDAAISAMPSVRSEILHTTDAWLASYATHAISGDTIANTGSGTASYCYETQVTAVPVVTGRKFYVKAKVRVTNASCSGLFVRWNGNDQSVTAQNTNIYSNDTPAQNTWYETASVVTMNNAGTSGLLRLMIRHQYADAATANGKVMEVKDVACYDLTAIYGVGNEPDLATFEALLNNAAYFKFTVANFISNWDFSSGLTTGWTHYGDYSAETVLSGWLRSTKNTTKPYPATNSAWAIPSGHKIYIRFLHRANKIGSVYIHGYKTGIGLDSVIGNYSATFGVSSGLYSNVVTAADTVNGLYFDCTLHTADGDYVELDGVIVYDLTAMFGAGNEPTAAQMDTFLADTAIAGGKNISIPLTRPKKYYWYDYSGNNRHMKLNGFAYNSASGWQSSPARIIADGVDDAIIYSQAGMIGAGVGLYSLFSVFKVPNTTGLKLVSAIANTAAIASYSIQICINGANLAVSLNSAGGTAETLTFTGIVTADRFMTVAATVTADKKVNVYVNGVYTGSSAAVTGTFFAASGFTMSYINTTGFYAVTHAATTPFNKALTAKEIKKLHNTIRKKYSGLNLPKA